MTFDYWKTTHSFKPFQSIEECEKFINECVELPDLKTFVDTPIRKSKIKKGLTSRGESLDSFFEYTFCTYMRDLKGHVVERNNKTIFLTYIDEKNKQCKFYPDFIVDGIYYEVKGRFTQKDECKKNQHPEVVWIFGPDIDEMRRELDKNLPNWKNNFTQTNITI